MIPARDEALNIGPCVTSLVASEYPDLEVIVVDDRSEDGTAEIARAAARDSATTVTVIEGEPLPEGWLGKPWACHQGVGRARGAVLLFTDADTTHGPGLLGRAVRELERSGADMLTLVGAQRMESFWERLVQPHVFLGMLFRFPSFERLPRNRHWRNAIANGQYLLFTREGYDRIGGHESVRDDVVEDLALAQRTKRLGLTLHIRGAEEELATRMYRSLPQLIEGWSKNLLLGGLRTVHPVLRPIVAPATVLAGIGLWLVPPVALCLGAAGALSGGVTAWAAWSVAWSATMYSWFSHRIGAPARYGLIYPLGALVLIGIFSRSWVRGRRVEWKGRQYVVPASPSQP